MRTDVTTLGYSIALYATLSQCLVFTPYATESSVPTTIHASSVTETPSLQSYGYEQNDFLLARQVGPNFQTCGYIAQDYGRPVTCNAPAFCAYQTGAIGNYGPGCCTDLDNCIRATTCLGYAINANHGASFINKQSSLLCGPIYRNCATHYQEGINRGETSPTFTHYLCADAATAESVFQYATNLPTTVVSTAVPSTVVAVSVATPDPSTVVSVSVVTETPSTSSTPTTSTTSTTSTSTSSDPTTSSTSTTPTSSSPDTTSTALESETSTSSDSSAAVLNITAAMTEAAPVPSAASGDAISQAASTTPTPSPTSSPTPLNKAAIGGGVGGGIAAIIVLGVLAAWLLRRKRIQKRVPMSELANS